MTTVHRTTIVGKCPHGCHDIYEAEFATHDLIRVEDIQSAIERHTAEPIYQEHLTQRLADEVGCEVTTTGRHGQFTTTCKALPGDGGG